MEERREYTMRIESSLDEEIAALIDLHACQKRMYDTVIRRDWVSLQRETENREELASAIEACEAARRCDMNALFPDVKDSDDFYRMTAGLGNEVRTRLNGKYRELKRLVLLSKSENDLFESYLSHSRTLLSNLIETFVPARRSRIYAKNGSLRSGPVESLVLNRSF